MKVSHEGNEEADLNKFIPIMTLLLQMSMPFGK